MGSRQIDWQSCSYPFPLYVDFAGLLQKKNEMMNMMHMMKMMNEMMKMMKMMKDDER